MPPRVSCSIACASKASSRGSKNIPCWMVRIGRGQKSQLTVIELILTIEVFIDGVFFKKLLHSTHGEYSSPARHTSSYYCLPDTDGTCGSVLLALFRLRSEPAYRAVTIFSLRMADKPGLGDIAVITRWYIARKQGRLRRNVKSSTRDIHRLFNHRRGVVRQSQQVTNFQCSGNSLSRLSFSRDREIPPR